MTSVDLRVILVGTLYDSNIGAVSRAMANMGAGQLILLRPKCEITYAAQQAAATGQSALQNRRVYQTWEELRAQEPEGLRIALTARSGRLREVRDLSETLEWCAKNLPQFAATPETKTTADAQAVYLVLGPEDAGLAQEDLQQAHHACSIPTFGENTSLNLAQAALLTLFIFRQSRLGALPSTQNLEVVKDGELAEDSAVKNIDETLQRWLATLGFDVRENQMSAYTVLRRLILHSVPTKKEMRTLEVVLHQSIRKLSEYQAMRAVLNEAGLLANAPASNGGPREPAAH